ncbi:MAG TPA: type II toxin-antitoxin system PemK/MazF family toxin [Candidatus Acidoferrum sp.]|nr:type II toxin-antitoxin system PemK/MazF family toxin [Candidatus Acidoferrum sp.]
MPNFKQGDVVRVPFPYTDQAARQYRPALVIAGGKLEADHGLLWVLMITSARNRGWPGDVVINNLSTAGLPVASVIRTAKIATIKAGDAARLGKVTPATMKLVLSHVQASVRD